MLLEKIPPFVKLVGWKYSFSGTSPHPHMSSRQKKWRGHRNQQKQSTNRAIGKQQLGFGVMPTKIVLLEIVEGPVLYTIISIHQQTSVPPPNSLTSFYLLKYLQAFFFCSVPDPLSRHTMKHPYILSQLFPRFQLLFPGQADKSQISRQSRKGAQWRCRLSQTWEVGLHLPRPEKMTYDSCDN